MDEWAKRLTAWLETVDWDAFVSGIDALLDGGERLEKEFGMVGTAINFVTDNLGTMFKVIVGANAVFGALKIGSALWSITKGVAGVIRLVPKLVLTQLAKWGTGFMKFAQVAWGALAFLGKAFLKAGPIGWGAYGFESLQPRLGKVGRRHHGRGGIDLGRDPGDIRSDGRLDH